MKTNLKPILAALSVILLVISAISTVASPILAEEPEEPSDVKLIQKGHWIQIETDIIALMFPVNGSKPMFLWWYTENPEKVYIVKFKGVTEYLTFDAPYYLRKHIADGQTICKRIREKFIESKASQLRAEIRNRIRERLKFVEAFITTIFSLHPPYLPFSSCKWALEGPVWVKKGDVSYLSFNFTLVKSRMPSLKFAENNIEIRCRFYNTTTTESVNEKYSYTVEAGQLKMDFVVKNWSWNIAKIQAFLDELQSEYNVTVPPHKSGLALWVNLASINKTKLELAENELTTQGDSVIEENSEAKVVQIGNEIYSLDQNETASGEDEKPLRMRDKLRENLRIHFGRIKEEETVAGFFEFVPWARLLNDEGETEDFVNVTGSYISAGGYLRLFICYPFFGNLTLEHDPSIGLVIPSAPPAPPSAPTLLTPELLGALIIAGVAIAAVIFAIRWRKGFVNVVRPY